MSYPPLLNEMDTDACCISLVYQYLSTHYASLGRLFKAKFKPLKTDARLEDLLLKWFEEQLLKGLVLKHLKIVAPVLALEFKKYHSNVHEDVPGELETLILRIQRQNVGKISKAFDSKNCTGVESKVGDKRHGLGSKQNMFSMEEVARIQSAITKKEDIGLLAKQMGNFPGSGIRNKQVSDIESGYPDIESGYPDIRI